MKSKTPKKSPATPPPRDELAERVSAALTRKNVSFEAKRMMGGMCFLVDGKMFAGTAKNRLMLRFDPALHEEVLSRPGASPMDFTGKPMRGYVFVQPSALSSEKVLNSWLDLALEFNPRAKSSKKPKKRAA
jgi:TfoX/Sxy family transcriptional regulator of competence genes